MYKEVKENDVTIGKRKDAQITWNEKKFITKY